MRKEFTFVVLLLFVAAFAAGCSQKTAEPASQTGAQKGVGIVIAPEEGAADVDAQKPAETQPEAVTTPEAKTETKTEPETAEAAEPAEETAEKPAETSQAASVKLGEMTCDEKETLGYLGCKNLADGKAELSVKNTGREDLDGIYIKYNRDDVLAGEKSEPYNLTVGTQAVFTLDIKTYSSDRVEVFPVQEGSICINKQLVVIPITNCR